MRRYCSCGLTLLATFGLMGSGIAAVPAIQGPEAVKDWPASGERFLRQARDAKKPKLRAMNVILFVGDGMGMSTLQA